MLTSRLDIYILRYGDFNPRRICEGYCSCSVCLRDCFQANCYIPCFVSPKCGFVWFLSAFQMHVLCGFRCSPALESFGDAKLLDF